MSVSFFATYTGHTHSLNVSNSNAMHLLGILELDHPGWCGQVAAKELLIRVERAIRGVTQMPDEFTRNTTVTKGDGPLMIDFGVSDTYLLDRLHRLRVIAHEAQTLDADVGWC